jgi:hypothetical protein
MTPRQLFLYALREHASPVPGETDADALAAVFGTTAGAIRRGLRDLREGGWWDVAEGEVPARKRAA